MVIRILFAVFAIAIVSGCKSTDSEDIMPKVVSVNDVEPMVDKSLAKDYLLAAIPLNETFISLPFLFDGDVLLLNDFDLTAWRNKRFIQVKGQVFEPQDSYAVDMQKGKIRSLSGNVEFKVLMQSLLIKIMPLNGLDNTPPFLVMTNLVSKDADHSVIIIEDPVSLKIHGFIESALVNSSFSSSLYRVDN